MRKNSTPRQDRRLVCTVEEAAVKLDVSRNTAYALVKSGELPAVRFGRLLRVPIAALEAKLAQPQR